MMVEKTSNGFSTYSEDYPVFTTGSSIIELPDNAVEAANLYFLENGLVFNKNKIVFELDFDQFFKYYKGLNAKYLADVAGVNPTLLSQYVSGLKKPSARQTKKIIE